MHPGMPPLINKDPPRICAGDLALYLIYSAQLRS